LETPPDETSPALFAAALVAALALAACGEKHDTLTPTPPMPSR